MKGQSLFRKVHHVVRNHGIAAAGYNVAVRAVHKFVYARILQCVFVDAIEEKYLLLPAQFRFCRLSRAQLDAYAEFPQYELSRAFVEHATRKGDECYAILDGDALASYGWYARSATPIENDDLRLRFDGHYVYMYKGFTLDRYRGQRLHAIGMTRALAEYRQLGFHGLVSYVESHNFDSLKSCYRMGYRRCGRIYFMRFAGRYLIRQQRECDAYGLAIEVRPLDSRPQVSAGTALGLYAKPRR